MSHLTSRPLKIDLIVHGRFYAFDLARELINLGHDVLVYTNYPKLVAKRFGLPSDHVRSFLAHGIMTRLQHRLDPHRSTWIWNPTFIEVLEAGRQNRFVPMPI